MKYFDAFSGYGGFSLGIQQAYEDLRPIQQEFPKGTENLHDTTNKLEQWKCVGFSEIDKYAIQVYNNHFPDHKKYGDITKIDWNTVPDFDLLTGGSPCQDFSIAGKRAGIKGERSGLVWEYIRCLKEKKPRYFIWENVKGVMSSRRGFDFANILTAFSEAGYDLQWQVLNAKDFGVPQNRERIFIIGSRGEPRSEVFHIGSSYGQDIEQDRGKSNIVTTIKVQRGAMQNDSTFIRQLNNPKHSNNRLYGEDGISPALNTAQGGNRQPKIPVITPDRLKKRQNGRRMKEDGDPSFTLTAQDRHGIYDGMKIRRLTPLECSRLMGLPDYWFDIEGLSDSQKYKLAGNGVVIQVVEHIIKKLFCAPTR